MYLMYVDESGKSGLHDPLQPNHILCGVIIEESQWLPVETMLLDEIDRLVPPPRPDGWELHAVDMYWGKDFFGRVSRSTRAALFAAVLDVIETFGLTLEVIVIDKPGLCAKYSHPFPPALLAYEFILERFQYYLGNKGPTNLGMVVSDDQKGDEATIREAHRRYRQQSGTYSKGDQIVETPFFVPSHASCMLQIADVGAYIVNRTWRARAKGTEPPQSWERLYPHIDHLRGKWVGLKVFPTVKASP